MRWNVLSILLLLLGACRTKNIYRPHTKSAVDVDVVLQIATYAPSLMGEMQEMQRARKQLLPALSGL